MKTGVNRRLVFVVAWVLAVALQGWGLGNGPAGMATKCIVAVTLSAVTLALLRLFPNPLDDEGGGSGPWFVPVAIGLFLFLVLISGVLERGMLYILMMGVAMGFVMANSRKDAVDGRMAAYAGFLAVVAGYAALWAGKAVPKVPSALIHAVLVPTALLAGWGILLRTGLHSRGIGSSRFLSCGLSRAMGSFATGMLVAVPWAMGNAMIITQVDTWVKTPWQALCALQPGIAEEAWGRLLLVPLLFLILRKAANERAALTAAILVAGYWFAYIHYNDLGSALVLGTLFSLPLSFLCLFRDPETAMGFHFLVDFVRFAAAYLVMRG